MQQFYEKIWAETRARGLLHQPYDYGDIDPRWYIRRQKDPYTGKVILVDIREGSVLDDLRTRTQEEAVISIATDQRRSESVGFVRSEPISGTEAYEFRAIPASHGGTSDQGEGVPGVTGIKLGDSISVQLVRSRVERPACDNTGPETPYIW